MRMAVERMNRENFFRYRPTATVRRVRCSCGGACCTRETSQVPWRLSRRIALSMWTSQFFFLATGKMSWFLCQACQKNVSQKCKQVQVEPNFQGVQ